MKTLSLIILSSLATLISVRGQDVVLSIDPASQSNEDQVPTDFQTFPPMIIPGMQPITFPPFKMPEIPEEQFEVTTSEPKWIRFSPVKVPGLLMPVELPPVRIPGLTSVDFKNETLQVEATPTDSPDGDSQVLTFKPIRIPGLAKPFTFPAIKLPRMAHVSESSEGSSETTTYQEVNASALTFDCRRFQHDCSFIGGMCDMDSGECQCLEGFAGFDCSVELSTKKNVSFCNDGSGCGNDKDSHCYWNRDKMTDECFCPYGFRGVQCQDPPISLKCSEDSILIEVWPYPSFMAFEGLMFLINASNDVMMESPKCRFNQAEGMYRFEASFEDLVTECGGVVISENAHGARFIIQADPHWLTPFDQIFNVKCISKLETAVESSVIVAVSGSANAIPGPGKDPVGVSNSLTNIPINEIVAEHKKISTAALPKVDITVSRIIVENISHSTNYTIAPITEPLRIGDPVEIKVFTVNTTVYSSMRTEDCLLKMDNTVEMKMIRKSCPASKFAWNLLRWDRTKVTNNSIAFWLILPANALAGQMRYIDIYCRVKVCTEEAAADCEIKEDGCSMPRTRNSFYPKDHEIPNYGRRKREVAAPNDQNLLEQQEMFEDFFSSHPYVYTTVHQRLRVRSVNGEHDTKNVVGRVNDALGRFSTSRSSKLTSAFWLLTSILFAVMKF